MELDVTVDVARSFHRSGIVLMGDDGDVTATESTDELTQFEHGVLSRGRRVIPQRGFSMRPERIVAAALLMTPPSFACAFLRS
jgi:hypothetical protein